MYPSLTHGSLGPRESSPQTVYRFSRFRSVHGRDQYTGQTDRQTDRQTTDGAGDKTSTNTR